MSESVEMQLAFRNRRYVDAGGGLEARSRQMSRTLDAAAPVLSRELKTFLEGAGEAMARRPGGSLLVGGTAAVLLPGFDTALPVDPL